MIVSDIFLLKISCVCKHINTPRISTYPSPPLPPSQQRNSAVTSALAISLSTRRLKFFCEAMDMWDRAPDKRVSNSSSVAKLPSMTRSFSHHGMISGTPYTGSDSWKKSLCSSSAGGNKTCCFRNGSWPFSP